MVTELRKQAIARTADIRMRKHRQISRVIRAEDQAIEDMAREYAGAALDTLVTVMNDEDAPARDRIKASTEILDRAFGRPMERSAVLTLNPTQEQGQDFTQMNTRDLIAYAMRRSSSTLAHDSALPQTTPGIGAAGLPT
jgi:hypothetical protein